MKRVAYSLEFLLKLEVLLYCKNFTYSMWMKQSWCHSCLLAFWLPELMIIFIYLRVLMLGSFLLALDIHFADRSSFLIRIWALGNLNSELFNKQTRNAVLPWMFKSHSIFTTISLKEICWSYSFWRPFSSMNLLFLLWTVSSGGIE